MIRHFVISILVLVFVIANTQAQLIQVSGFIYTKDSAGVVPFANVYNKKTKTGSQANFEGFYAILVAQGDTIEVTAIGYQKETLSLPRTFIGSSFYYNVALSHVTYDLPEFTKYRINMEIFTREFTDMNLPEEKRWITVDQGQIVGKAPVRTSLGYTINGPFTWLYNKFSKRAKEMSKLADLKAGELDNFRATERLTADFISMATGLPTERTMDLAAYCDISTQALANYSNYDLIIALQNCLVSYKKDKNLTDEDLGIKKEALPNDSIK